MFSHPYALFAGAAMIFAAAMVFQRSLYSAAICLLGVLIQVASLFFLMGSQLLGFLQVLVYAGAVMVMIVVAVMAAPARLTRRWAPVHGPPWLIASVLGAPIIELLWISRLPLSGQSIFPPAAKSLEVDMASVLFGPYALLTETVGLLILVAALAVLNQPIKESR